MPDCSLMVLFLTLFVISDENKFHMKGKAFKLTKATFMIQNDEKQQIFTMVFSKRTPTLNKSSTVCQKGISSQIMRN